MLATGTVAALPPIAGLAEPAVGQPRRHRGQEVPRRLLVLGGGAVGVEMAQAFRRLGATAVTVIEGGERLLLARSRSPATRCGRPSRPRGSRWSPVLEWSRSLGRAATAPDGHSGGRLDLHADEILVAAGRRAATADLGLETVGLKPATRFEVDPCCAQSASPAAGCTPSATATGWRLLTHMGKYQARIAGDVILGKDARDRASDDVVPRVTFTDPQVCAVGLTEARRASAGIAVRVVTTAPATWPAPTPRQRHRAAPASSSSTRRAGVRRRRHVHRPGVQELLHSATVAIAGEVPLERLWHAVPSFPTISEVWLRLLEAYGL